MARRRLRIGLLLLGFVAIGVTRVHGHGRLVEPPSRATAWRYGFSTEKDYNDNESYCGGWARQHQRNAGRCGVCGDAWDLPQPRAHEQGGRYGQGVIVRTYKMNAAIEIGVEIIANHQGYFEFRICPHNGAKEPETDECFEQHVLRRADAEANDTLAHRYYLGNGNGEIFRSVYQLPEGLTCTQCVLQWRYVAGNNWGTCPDGRGKLGCGPQEEFRGCADVKITVDGVPDVPVPSTTSTTPKPRTRNTVTSRYTRPTTKSASSASPLTRFPTRTTTTTTPTTSTVSSTASSTTTSTTESVEFNEIIPPDRYGDGGGVNPGTYIGIIIALGTLLFAILLVLGLIFYFYHCHRDVKAFVRRHWRVLRDRVSGGPNEPELPPKVPAASVFASHPPPNVTASSGADYKPPVPPRTKRHPNHANLRLVSLTISEPLDVAINGVTVSRDGGVAAHGEEANVSIA